MKSVTDIRRVIKDTCVSDFIGLISEKIPDKLNGYTAGYPPTTLRYLTSKNEFVMVTVDNMVVKSEGDETPKSRIELRLADPLSDKNVYALDEIVKDFEKIK